MLFRSVIDSTVGVPGYAIDNSDLAGEIPPSISGAADLLMNDPWGGVLQVTKSGNLITVWSTGPHIADAPANPLPVPDGLGANPLYVSVNCQTGSDLAESFRRIGNAVIGDLLADPVLDLPPDNDLSGLNIDLTDPWGAAIGYRRVDVNGNLDVR